MRIFLIISLLCFHSLTNAEQKIIDGNYQIHYSVFPSTSISPEVAARYNIQRSEYRALVNITPQYVVNDMVRSIRARITGNAKNLVGNSKDLTFKEIVEQDTVYYLSSFAFSNEEHIRFNLEIIPEDEPNKIIPLKFEKKFYRD